MSRYLEIARQVPVSPASQGVPAGLGVDTSTHYDINDINDQSLAEVAWRCEAMRPQVPRRGPIPFLVARPGVPAVPGACWSCGDRLPDDEPDRSGLRVRCRLCVEAARRVVYEVREGVQHG